MHTHGLGPGEMARNKIVNIPAIVESTTKLKVIKQNSNVTLSAIKEIGAG